MLIPDLLRGRSGKHNRNGPLFRKVLVFDLLRAVHIGVGIARFKSLSNSQPHCGIHGHDVLGRVIREEKIES